MAPWFDEVTVQRHQVEHAVIVGEPRQALSLAGELETPRDPESVNLNRHLLDVASAQCSVRNYTESFEILQSIRSIAPEWLAHQRLGQETLSRILDNRARAVTAEMRDLAEFLHVGS